MKSALIILVVIDLCCKSGIRSGGGPWTKTYFHLSIVLTAIPMLYSGSWSRRFSGKDWVLPSAPKIAMWHWKEWQAPTGSDTTSRMPTQQILPTFLYSNSQQVGSANSISRDTGNNSFPACTNMQTCHEPAQHSWERTPHLSSKDGQGYTCIKVCLDHLADREQ